MAATNIRLDDDLYEDVKEAAFSKGVTINAFIVAAIKRSLNA